jgi:hypothetical protein
MTTVTQIIQAAYREGNLIGAGKSPTSAELIEAVPMVNRVIAGLMGFEMGEPLTDWLVPSPQRTAPVAARWPQGPLVSFAEDNPLNLGQSNCVWPYPPTNKRIVFGAVTGTVYFPEAPLDGSRMAIVQGSGLGCSGVPGTATGALTYTALPVAATTVTINAQVYTWRAALTSPAVANEVLIGPSVAGSLVYLAAAINGGVGSGTTYSSNTVANTGVTASCSQSVLTVTAILSGTAGNSIATTTTSGTGSWGAATLAGGTAGAILTLDGNGRYISNAGTQAYQTPVPRMQWVFRADTGIWMPTQDLTATDTMPFPEDFDDFFICVTAKRLAPRYTKVLSAETQLTAKTSLMNFKSYYRQAALTTYNSENIPRTDQSYLGGSWWW